MNWISELSLQVFNVFCLYLPQEEEAECDLARRHPNTVEVNHKVHQLLGVSWNQVDDFSHRALPASCTAHHQTLFKQENFISNIHSWVSTHHNTAVVSLCACEPGNWSQFSEHINATVAVHHGSYGFLLPSCRWGPWGQFSASFPQWSSDTCTDGAAETAGRTAGRAARRTGNLSTWQRPRPAWSPAAGWQQHIKTYMTYSTWWTNKQQQILVNGNTISISVDEILCL